MQNTCVANLSFSRGKLGAGDIFKEITHKKAILFRSVLLTTREKQVSSMFKSSTSTGGNNQLPVTEHLLCTKHSSKLFINIIFNPIIFKRKEFFSLILQVRKQAEKKYVIYQGYTVCIWEHWASNLGPGVHVHTPTHI